MTSASPPPSGSSSGARSKASDPDEVVHGLGVNETQSDQLERLFQVFRDMGIAVSDSEDDAEMTSRATRRTLRRSRHLAR